MARWTRKRVLAWSAVALAVAPVAVTTALARPATTTQVDQLACSRARLDPSSHVVRWLGDCGRVDLSRGPTVAASRLLDRLSGALGVGPGDALVHIATDRTPLGARVRFAQSHQGTAVYLGTVLVQIADDGRVLAVNSGVVPALTVDVTPRVTRDAAVRAARLRAAGVLRAPATATLQVAALSPAAPVLAWHVVLPTAKPADWHVFVDARTGAVVAAWDQLYRDTGSGDVYHPNAVQSSGNVSLADSGDATSPALDAARTQVVLEHLDAGTSKLKGAAADLTGTGVTGCNLPYTPGAAAEPSRTYSYPRSDDRFEEVTAYAAIDGAQSLFQELGFANVNNRPIPVDVHCTSADNSFYSSTDRAVHFGDGGVDDAEDADIVLHEYGHAVHDAQVDGWGPGINTEQRAMGEGWGDLLAALYYAFTGDAAYQAQRLHCVGEWDAVSYNPVDDTNPGSGCLRWTNGMDETLGTDIGSYPGVPTQEHNDGRFWSAALTCVFDGMGADEQARDDVLRLVLAHHFLLEPDITPMAFERSVDALLAVDDEMFEGAHRNLIGSCADQRLGIQVPGLDDTPPDVVASVAPKDADGSNGWYRSSPTVTWEVSDPESPVLSEDGCEPSTVSTDTKAVTFTCTATSAGGTRSVSVTLKRDATAPTLAPKVTPEQVQLGGSATAAANASDATSGVASSGCDAVDATAVGTRSVACTATDAAGNTGSASALYRVVYPFTGFFGVTNLPASNDVPAGRTVSLSFGLGGDRGLDVLAEGSPTSQRASCDTWAPVGGAEPASTPGRADLHYSAPGERYTYHWKTDRSWAGTCRVLSVALDDDTTHKVAFAFR